MLGLISNVFESCGFTMNADKFKYGQQIVFLGILIDSVSMTVRFDPISAKSFRIELEVYRRQASRHSRHPTNLRQTQLVCRTSAKWSNAYNLLLELSSTLQVILSSIDEPVTDGSSMVDSPPVFMGTGFFHYLGI